MKKIFVVEDDKDIQEIVGLVFKKVGYEVVPFYRGDDFVKSCYLKADVIILDKQLPGLDGLEICRNLKSTEISKKIPVIMLSAHPDIKDLAHKAGAEESMEKPFKINELRSIVSKYIEQ